MKSRFNESFGLIMSHMDENVYKTQNEIDFIFKYVKKCRVKPSESETLTTDVRFSKAIFAAFKFIYEIELVLDAIEIEGVSLSQVEALMNYCNFLWINSSEALISIDDEFSFSNKYSLASDIYKMAENLYKSVLLVHSTAIDDLPHETIIDVTKYDEVEIRFICKYIRNGLAVLKLFHVLALFQMMPCYSVGIQQIATQLLQSLREVLYNKRIIRLVVDSDIQGRNDKLHKSTRLKIYFAMSNLDRYCIRLDFPHQGEESIHLNMNEPSRKQSTGLPFRNEDYTRAMNICENEDVFEKLFYYRDDLYWFRSNYATTANEIGNSDSEKGDALAEFLHDKAHVLIAPSNDDNKTAVKEFAEVLAETIAEYEMKSVYGETDTDDTYLYQLVLFQDVIYSIVIKLREQEIRYKLFDAKRKHSCNNCSDDLSLCEENIKAMICSHITKKFSHDKALIKLTESNLDLPVLIEKCLDYFDQIGL